jgi:translation initiation factor IF-1
MPKNTKGGSGHKRMANKNNGSSSGYSNKLRRKNEEGEIYARVIKLNGGQFAYIKCEDGVKRNLVIRAKFRRRKRGNLLSADTLVLAGLRDWEVTNGKKLEKADLLEVYTGNEATTLQKSNDIPECLFEAKTEKVVDGDLDLSFDRSATSDDFVKRNVIVRKEEENVKVEKRGADKEMDMDEINWDDI